MFIILCAIIGIFSVSLLSNLPSAGTFFSFIAIIITAIGCLLRISFLVSAKNSKSSIHLFKNGPYLRYILVLVISFLLGFSYSYIKARSLLDRQLAIDLDNKTFVVEGVISSLIKKTSSTVKFDFTVKHLYLEESNKNLSRISDSGYKTIRLSYYINKKRKKSRINKVLTGDYWQFKVKLKRPRGFVNPSGFDYQAYLLSQELSATGYIKDSEGNRKLANACKDIPSSIISINCLRASLNSFLDKNFSHSHTLGVLKGLLTGDKQSITVSQWDTLKNTGTIHLLAISGLHIGLAASIGFFLGKFFRRLLQLIIANDRFRLFKNFQIGRYIPPVFSVLLALTYSLLAGFSLPTQRALIMVMAFHYGLLLYRKSRPWFLWSTALFLTALINPLAIYQQGFWLSFAAVAILILVFNSYTPYKKTSADTHTKFTLKDKCYQFLLGFSKAQWAVSIGLLLPSLLLLNGVSALGFIANFIAIPFVSLVTVPLILIGLLLLPIASSLALVIFSIADKSIYLLFIMLEYTQQLGIKFWPLSLGGKPILVLSIAIVGTFYLLLPKGMPVRWLGFLCILPVFLTSIFPELSAQKELPTLKTTIFDVGQGTAIIVETPSHTLIYDAGKRYSDSFDVGEHILSPYLLEKRRRNVDRLIISHNDADHAGGVGGLLKSLTIKSIYAGESAKNKHIDAKQCKAGQQWQWEGVDFKVVWPNHATVLLVQNTKTLKSNNLSCVLLITYESYSILLAGDIEENIEKQLIASGLIPEGITLLLAPHHGSKTSSHSQWINYVQPRYVAFSAGYKNSYHHPHFAVVRGYRDRGASTLNTANDGAIQFTINDSNAVIETSRKAQKRYWYD